LLENTVQRPSRQVIVGFSWHGDSAIFRRVLELSMAAPCPHVKPTVGLQHANDIPHFHCGTLAADGGARYSRMTWDRMDSRARRQAASGEPRRFSAGSFLAVIRAVLIVGGLPK